jgi:uncharacterized membrane protein YfcA
MALKFAVLGIVILAFLCIWLVPKTRIARRLPLGEKGYKIIHGIGLITGITGLAVTLSVPALVLEGHVYELLLLPVFFVYAVYPLIVAQVRKNWELYDEKQLHDMTVAAAVALPVTTITMFLVYAFMREGALEGLVWFPLFVFTAVSSYAGATLVLFRRC